MKKSLVLFTVMSCLSLSAFAQKDSRSEAESTALISGRVDNPDEVLNQLAKCSNVGCAELREKLLNPPKGSTWEYLLSEAPSAEAERNIDATRRLFRGWATLPKQLQKNDLAQLEDLKRLRLEMRNSETQNFADTIIVALERVIERNAKMVSELESQPDGVLEEIKPLVRDLQKMAQNGRSDNVMAFKLTANLPLIYRSLTSMPNASSQRNSSYMSNPARWRKELVMGKILTAGWLDSKLCRHESWKRPDPCDENGVSSEFVEFANAQLSRGLGFINLIPTTTYISLADQNHRLLPVECPSKVFDGLEMDLTMIAKLIGEGTRGPIKVVCKVEEDKTVPLEVDSKTRTITVFGKTMSKYGCSTYNPNAIFDKYKPVCKAKTWDEYSATKTDIVHAINQLD